MFNPMLHLSIFRVFIVFFRFRFLRHGSVGSVTTRTTRTPVGIHHRDPFVHLSLQQRLQDSAGAAWLPRRRCRGCRGRAGEEGKKHDTLRACLSSYRLILSYQIYLIMYMYMLSIYL
jgi:hypothetical protein